MFAWIVRLTSWALSLWGSLPESTKDKIIESIVELFTELFRSFYRSCNKSEESKNDQA